MKTYTTRSNAKRAADSFKKKYFNLVVDTSVIPMGEGYAVGLVLRQDTLPEGLTAEMAVITVKTEDIPEHNDCRVPVIGEFTHCPHCHIDLLNGYQTFDNLNSEGADVSSMKYEYICLACGEEFGPEINRINIPKETESTHEILNKSSISNPCKTVWNIAEKMHAEQPGVRRAQVLEACVNAGIAYYTARTQYQAWLSACKEMKAREAAQAKK